MHKLETLKKKKMLKDNEFPGVEKKTLYKVPDDFFEKVSENTLLKAKQKEYSRRKSLVLWRTMAVAASLAALFFLGYLISDSEIRRDSNLMVNDSHTVEQKIIRNQEITQQITVTEIEKTDPEKISEKINAEETDTEEIGDVLADLTDDELLQMSAMFKTDPFISESAQ